jgi:hypothetical protein
MLDVAAVREFAIAEGLGDHVAQIIEAVRPGWVLEPDIAGEVSVPGVSKIGGDPDLAEREWWPVNASGTALTFLAQINCSSLPELPGLWPDPDPWRHRGTLLRVFADLEMPGEPCAAVAMTTDPSARVGRVGRPPPARGQPGENQDARLPESVVVAQPFLSVPEVLPGLRAEVWDTTELADRYARFGERFRRSFIRAEDYPYRGSQPHHLLGESFSIQDDVRLTPAMVAEDEDAARTWGIAPDPDRECRVAFGLSIGTPATQTLSLMPTVRPASGPSGAPGIEHRQLHPLDGFSSPVGR